MENPLIIAYYLPQFHPIAENDEWWGKGFTEWTNVGKAKPLYKGHYQPRVPADLGYYDLRIPSVREQQAQLAREAGVGGFCYWHYWFGPGKQLMNEIIDEVAATGSPDFPFCLGWANESWYKKMWDKNSNEDRLLIEQTYGGESDYRAHYEYVRTLFQNKNYIRIDGNPFFLIYKPEQFADVELFIQLWNKWVKEDGIADKVYFVANIEYHWHREQWISKGFSAITPMPNFRLHRDYMLKHGMKHRFKEMVRKQKRLPLRISLEDVNKNIIFEDSDYDDALIPFLFPQWDHSPRSANSFRSFIVESTPEMFKQQAQIVLQCVMKKNNKVVMLKSWNEWAEGNYMEPDIVYGKAYINALAQVLSELGVR